MSTEYLSKKAAAEYLSVSIATLERLMRQGLPYIKLERRVLFERQDVDTWLLARKVVSGTPAKPPRRPGRLDK